MEKEGNNMSKIISISGPESSGKTTLAIQLASRLKAPLIEEQSRPYLKEIGKDYKKTDLVKIGELYLKILNNELSASPDFIIVDTSILDILIWSEIKYGQVSNSLRQLTLEEPACYYLLTSPDLEYEPDELRESPEVGKRNRIFNAFHNHLRNSAYFIGVIEGNDTSRFKNAFNLLKSHFSL